MCNQPRKSHAKWYIAKLVADGLYKEALRLYAHHHSLSCNPHTFTFPPLFKACTKLGLSSHGQMLHTHLVKTGLCSNVYASTALMCMNMRLGSLHDALKVFDEMPNKNVASLNAAISGLSGNGHQLEALRMFKQTRLGKFQPNSVTIASLLTACETIHHGKQIHSLAVKLGLDENTYVATSLLTMYSNCQELVSANEVFVGLPSKNVVTYNAFLSGLKQNRFTHQVLYIFNKMMECADDGPNAVSLVSVLSACASLMYLQFGKQVHGFIMKSKMQLDVMVGTALVDMYSKCGNWELAFNVFKELDMCRNLITWNSMISGMMINAQSKNAIDLFQKLSLEGLEPDSATWNTMISGFSQLGKSVEAFEYFRKMQSVGLIPSLKTITSLLPACSDLCLLRNGKEVHGHAIRIGISTDEFISTALVDMYMKCGHPPLAQRMFNQFDIKPDDPTFWNAMIAGYGKNGDYESAFKIFELMRANVVQPNATTFVIIMSVCSHTGQVDKGLQVFKMMKDQYGLQTNPKHIGAIVDVFARHGWLKEAQELVQEPMGEPSVSAFASLLDASRRYLDFGLGEEMAMKLLDSKPRNPAFLVILSNIYAELGRWLDVERIREMINDKGLDKLPGYCTVRV